MHASGITFDDDPGRQRQLEAIGVEQLGFEMAWLRGKLEREEDHGTTTRATEVRCWFFALSSENGVSH